MPSPVQRIAIVDIGSNSIKLLVADFEGTTLRKTLHSESDETRIGGFLGMGKKEMTEEAIRAGVMSVEKLMRRAASFHPDQRSIVATSAVREAENRNTFCRWIHEITGCPVTLLSGEEEAEAIAQGVRCDPSLSTLQTFFILDQGGGSLEIIYSDASKKQSNRVSLPLGAVRLFKQFQNGDLGPLSPAARENIRKYVDQQWNLAPWLASTPPAPWIGTGGALTLTRHLLAQRNAISLQDAPHRLDYHSLTSFFNEISALPVTSRMTSAKLPASRADILPAGLAAILRIMERAKCDSLTHSIYNLRYGYASFLAQIRK